MNVLRRWPILNSPSTLEVAGQTVIIRPYQIALWVSLSSSDMLPHDAPRFPAILDSGHNHNFSIRVSQLIRWTGLRPEHCSKTGVILVNRQEVPLIAARLWVHRNRAGTSELMKNPAYLPVPEGISVHPEHSTNAPRLPLLGLRGLVRNGWRVVIDAGTVSLSQQLPRRKSRDQ